MASQDDLRRNRAARVPKPKPPKRPIRRISDKTKAKIAAEKKLRTSDGDTLKEKWFKARRREMVGTCQCGCGEPSQKKDDLHFRSSAAHIFPKRDFGSIEYHPRNWVERRVWGGCHDVMDNTSIQRWPGMADWDDIKEKFHLLVPLLTREERGKKFYTMLEKLVYEN